MSAKRWRLGVVVIAARLRPFYDAKAKERQVRKPADSVPVKVPGQKHDARDAAGKAANVNGKRWRYVILALLAGIRAGLVMEHVRSRPSQPLLWDLPGAIRTHSNRAAITSRRTKGVNPEACAKEHRCQGPT